jgi:hypothetical protein
MTDTSAPHRPYKKAWAWAGLGTRPGMPFGLVGLVGRALMPKTVAK